MPNTQTTSDLNQKTSSRTRIVPILPPGLKVEPFDDDYDPALEAEITEFYRTVLPEEDGSVAGSEEEWKDDCEGLDVLPRIRPGDEPVELDPIVELSPRMAQLEILGQTNLPCVYLTVHRMFEMYEFQLWDIVPVATLKDLMEDLTDVAPQDMRLYLKNGTILEEAKLLGDYGLDPTINHLDNPAQLFVGFKADLEYVSDDEVEEEEEDADADIELSPGLEYFETVSDIDFTSEIERDRDFDNWTEDVDGTSEYTIVRPEDGAGDTRTGLSAFPGPANEVTRDGIKTVSDSIDVQNRPLFVRKREEIPQLDDIAEEDFVPFTLKK